METEIWCLILPPLVFLVPFGLTQATSSSCKGILLCNGATSPPHRATGGDPCCLSVPSKLHAPSKVLFLRSLSPRSLSPLLPPSPPLPQPPTSPRNRTNGEEDSSKKQKNSTLRVTTLSPPPQMPTLPVWSNWYFWLFVALFLLAGLAACGYWRRRKIYESSASQTLSHANGLFPTPTPSDDTPLYGPPLPFLPPAAYPAPPPYSEAARPSYDRLDHRHLYDALLSGRTVYDFYDRRHPNAYYDRYFLPDDTSSSETTSLLSYHLQRSCSAHLPNKHHSVKKCHDMPPPYSEGQSSQFQTVPPSQLIYQLLLPEPENINFIYKLDSIGERVALFYTPSTPPAGLLETGTVPVEPENMVAAKPELYPVVIVKRGGGDCSGLNGSTTEMKSTKSMSDSTPLPPPPWLPPYHYFTYRSGSISTPEGSQASSVPGLGHHQNVLEWWRGPRGTISPATLLASCSGIPSPASSSGPLPSEVSSLAPTSPPSPPAPTSPTQQPLALQPSPASTREFRDVLHKISQLPRASSPTSPSGLSSECHSPGGMLSPVPITPGTSPGSNPRPRSCSRGSQTPWRTPSPISSPRTRRSKRLLMASLSMEGESSPVRPQSLYLEGNELHTLSSSASTPNLLSSWPHTPEQDFGEGLPLNRSRINFDTTLTRSRVTLDTSPPHTQVGPDTLVSRSRILHRASGRRWWDQQASIHHV